MMIFLGTQSYGSLAKPLDQPGCKLGMTNKLTDRVGPTSQKEKEKKRGNAAGLGKADIMGPTPSDLDLRTPCAREISQRKALGLRFVKIDPFICVHLVHVHHVIYSCAARVHQAHIHPNSTT